MLRWRRVDVTLQTLSAQLFGDEELIEQQDGVGLYDGKEKDAKHDDGRLILTSHRLIYVDALRPHHASASLDLSLVRQTEFWAGFLKSSAKITLLLGEPGAAISLVATGAAAAGAGGGAEDYAVPLEENAVKNRDWVCRICGFKNSPGPGGSGAKCSLCGVMRDPASSTTAATAPPSASPSRPASRAGTPRPVSIGSSGSPLSPKAAAAGGTEEGGGAQSAPPVSKDKRIPCPVCTFLNHPSMSKCEICDSALSTEATPVVSEPSSSSSRPTTPAPPAAAAAGTSTPPSGDVAAPFVKLSFRKGGERTFYSSLKKVLAAKEWDIDRPRAAALGARPVGSKADAGVGIDAILRGIDRETSQRSDEMEDALKDLNALMAKAKEMIAIAKTLNDRISAQEANAAAAASSPSAAASSSSSKEESTVIRRSLVNLGLPAPAVTADMAASDTAYHTSLAAELGGLLTRDTSAKSVLKRGLVGVDEVWLLWNRARGISMISPADFGKAVIFLPQHTKPRLRMRTFKHSGLSVLHTPRFAESAFLARLFETLDLRQALAASFTTAFFEVDRPSAEREGTTTVEVAQREGISAGMAGEMLVEIEEKGQVVRDEQGAEGTRWFRNWISTSGGRWVDPNFPPA